jgi:hypothetical protein
MTRSERYLFRQLSQTEQLSRMLDGILTGVPFDEASAEIEIPADEFDEVKRIVASWNYRLSTWEKSATDRR